MANRRTPFYHLVPKTWDENIAFRRSCWRRASNPSGRRLLWNMSARDPLFFVNVFGVLFEPRISQSIPFITFPIQDDLIIDLEESIGRCDVGIDKSRDMGGTWVILSWLFWRWLFRKNQAFKLVSRTEDLVDRRGDEDTLFAKLDYLYRHLPSWMQPAIGSYDRTHLKFVNPHRHNRFTGAATTGDISRGGRQLVIFLDEFHFFGHDQGYEALGATQSVARTRIFLSTPHGPAGAFYDMMHLPGLNVLRRHLHWKDHPLKARGLYTLRDGRLEILDKDYKFPEGYKFVLDGKLRSPWYDWECGRCPVPTIMAREHDIDYVGSVDRAFDIELIDMVIKRDARPSLVEGDLDYDSEAGRPLGGFEEREGGNLRLWAYPDAWGNLPSNRTYCIGCDIALGSRSTTGRGRTPSVASILDRASGVKVGMLVIGGCDPKDFAKQVVALARWLEGSDNQGAFLAWEDNGPGQSFKDEVLRLGYRHIYYRRNTSSIRNKITDHPGWFSQKDTKKRLLSEYQRALAAGEFVNRDEESLQEMKAYIITDDGRFEHNAAYASVSGPSSTRDNHGDRVIADAVAWLGAVGYAKSLAEQSATPYYSYAGRRDRRRRPVDEDGEEQIEGWEEVD